jgi:hypothetical protein
MVSSTHNLAVVYPELAKEWHPTKNNNLLPEDVLPRSTEKCWWKCIYCGSEWAARPHERKGRRGKPGCPTCASIEARKAIGKARSTPKPGRSLQELHPLLAKRWHPTKNKGIKPIEVNEKSHRKVWWKCPEGDDHEWEAGCASVVVAWKTVSRGCPYCSGKRASSTNSLAVIFPEIAEEWHPTKNGKLTPDKITPGSNKIVWWECQKSHIWEAKISNRTSTNKTGCPYCAVSSKVDSTNNLAVLHPELVKAWHPKNKRKPEEFRPGSNRKVWWICNKGPDHEWKAVIASRVQGYGCPCCSGHKLSVTNSLATKSPELVKEWHPTKNGKLTPGDVIAGAHRVVWWQCPEGPDHEWRISPGKRTSSDARTGRAVGTGCPACHGRQLSVTNNFALLYPELVPYWHPENNGELKPDQIVFGSPKRRWWKCPEGPDHEWRTTTTSLINSLKESGNYGCPFCSGLKVSVTNSLANHPESKIYWHPAKNGKITPADIVAGTNKKYWWKCPEGPDHEWKAASSGVVNSWKSGNSGCPCCKGLKWSVTNSLLINYPEAATHWHPTKNKDRKLEMVISGSDKRYWWKCQEGPDHEWNSNPRSKIMLQTGCPFCSGKRLSVTNSLATKYPEIAKEWHPTKNGDLTPENILAGSHKRVWWMCSNNPEHEWETIVDKRTGPEGTECPECLLKGTSKKEIRLAFELYKIFGLDYISKPRIKIGKRVFRPDILIEEHKLVVEYDGRWYHEDRAFDYEKTGALQEVGWNVIRVREIPLEKITENDVSVHHQEANKSVASRVLQQIEKVCDIKIPELADYLKLDRSINKRAADEYIAGLLRDAQQTTL